MSGREPGDGSGAAATAGTELDYELIRSSGGQPLWQNKRTGETRTTVKPSGGADLEDMRKRIRTSIAALSEKIRVPSEEAAAHVASSEQHDELPQLLDEASGRSSEDGRGKTVQGATVSLEAGTVASHLSGVNARAGRLAPAWASLRAAMQPQEPHGQALGCASAVGCAAGQAGTGAVAAACSLARLLGVARDGEEKLAPAWASLRAAMQPQPSGPALAGCPDSGEAPQAAVGTAGVAVASPGAADRLAPAWTSLKAAVLGQGEAAASLPPSLPQQAQATASAAVENDEAPMITNELPFQQQLEVQQAAMAAQFQQFMMQQHFHAQMRKLQRQAAADKIAGANKATSSCGSSTGSNSAALPPSERWVCSGCGFYNRISNKWCGGNGHLGCKAMRTDDAEVIKPSLLRPNAVPTIPEEARRYGDWNCPACGDYQFRRNPSCRTCGTLKPTEAPLDGIEPPLDPPRHGR
mmetsp:Transcript_71231/g.230630  ORF Transcript_71231/g.230630 Transcript_71231/m.230630 type:complete len:467 (-) Transcript_71231:419-1819(-)